MSIATGDSPWSANIHNLYNPERVEPYPAPTGRKKIAAHPKPPENKLHPTLSSPKAPTGRNMSAHGLSHGTILITTLPKSPVWGDTKNQSHHPYSTYTIHTKDRPKLTQKVFLIPPMPKKTL